MNYLKSSLRGTAHNLVKNVAITDVNYALARWTLMDRLDNKRFIVSMHLSAMLNYANLKTEDEASLRKFFGVFSQKIDCIWSASMLHSGLSNNCGRAMCVLWRTSNCSACNEFKKLKAHTRKDGVNSRSLCFNCLRPGHIVTICPSTHNWRQCQKRHHYHLQVDNQPGNNRTQLRQTV